MGLTGSGFVVAADRCTGCGACLATCPDRALRPGPSRLAGGRPPVILDRLCGGCGECVEICPSDAIEEVGR